MRWSLLLLLVAFSRLAFAEPKVAVAPLDGDDGKVADVVAEVVGERAKVTRPARVEGAMKSMGVGKLSGKSAKKLRGKLDVDVVVYGSLERDGAVKKLSLTFAGSGKATLEIEFASDKSLRKELSGKVSKRIASAMDGAGGDDEEDEDDARAKKEEERKREEERKKREEEEERKRAEEAKKREEDEKRAERQRRDDEDRRKKREEGERAAFRKRADEDGNDRKRRKNRDDEDDGRKKRVADEDEDEDEDDSGSARKRLGDEDEDDGDEDRPRRKKKRERRNVLTQAALWLDGGGAFARRTLTYASSGAMRPPRVGTAAPSGRIAGELYPASFSSLDGAAAGFGIAGAYSRTFGLGIDVPGTTVTTPVKNGHYSIGARYRFAFGQHSIALGVSYWRSYYMADRTQLMSPDLLDMPDVDYKAVAPGLALRVGVTPKISAFADVDLPLMLNSGPIQLPTSYGAAKILAFDVRAGSQIIIADHVAVQIAAEVEQVGLSFTGQPGSKAATRMVTKATDRSIGLAATIGITY